MKNKIKAALQQGQYKNLGLTDKAFDGAATLLATIITDEAEIETKVNSDEVKALLKSFQSVADEARAKSKNEPTPPPSDPGNQPEPEPQGEMAQLIKLMQEQNEQMRKQNEALTARFDAFENAQKAKTALSTAEETFKSNDYVKKYGDEATDAWERAMEMYEATGKSWTADELNTRAMAYFNKAVSRKGVDTTQPFKGDGGGSEAELDMSGWKKTMGDMGWEVPESK